MTWIVENFGTILVGTVLIALVAAILCYLVSRKKKGKSSCGCGCANCSMNGCCHSEK